MLDDLIYSSNQKDIIRRHLNKHAISLQLLARRKNRVASHFKIEKRAIKRNRVIAYFAIKEKIEDANENTFDISFFY